ncbi:MAG: elongation factor P maturation arginine rhamnosyltransferase EarP [Rectinemataceae bacterium]|jgi:uncharacterized repeat protein (TIGR03837 family)
MDIDILCKVVDNYGDIGVAYRLARSLSELPVPPRLRMVVDDLSAFAALDPAVDPDADRQWAQGWEVFRWAGPGTGEAGDAFRSRRPRIVVECFACGRPDWLEDILFDPKAVEGCLIVDLEHLTAEAYAEEFHRMPSLTRSPLVRKAMFLPGFGPGTGGLILDGSFARARARASSDAGRAGLRGEAFARLGAIAAGEVSGAADRFWICVFGYERDYSRIVADMAAFDGAGGEGRPILALVAAGKSQDCFLRAWTDAGRPFPALALPFLPQEAWDELIAASDFSIVRGEDSWSRAALSGRPFLWQAYPQAGRHQLIKIRAFLDLLRPHFDRGAFSALEALFLAFNDRERDGIDESGEERLLPVLELYSALLRGFRAFSSSLEENADLAAGLVTFLREIV